MSFNLDDYVDVAERIRIFRDKYPEGSLQSEITLVNEAVGDDRFYLGVLCRAWAYRAADDQRPGIGHSFLEIPGKTPYTKDSEVENAETSAWGRAIVAALAADTKKVASADEVRSKGSSSGAHPPASDREARTGSPSSPPGSPPTGGATEKQLNYARMLLSKGGHEEPDGLAAYDKQAISALIESLKDGSYEVEQALQGMGAEELDGIPFDRSIDGMGG